MCARATHALLELANPPFAIAFRFNQKRKLCVCTFHSGEMCAAGKIKLQSAELGSTKKNFAFLAPLKAAN
jgi:hypothetical protein